jgi:hypothetical protein
MKIPGDEFVGIDPDPGRPDFRPNFKFLGGRADVQLSADRRVILPPFDPERKDKNVPGLIDPDFEDEIVALLLDIGRDMDLG